MLVQQIIVGHADLLSSSGSTLDRPPWSRWYVLVQQPPCGQVWYRGSCLVQRVRFGLAGTVWSNWSMLVQQILVGQTDLPRSRGSTLVQLVRSGPTDPPWSSLVPRVMFGPTGPCCRLLSVQQVKFGPESNLRSAGPNWSKLDQMGDSLLTHRLAGPCWSSISN